MAWTEDDWAARAEFYLCLARAFAPPTEPDAYDGLRRYLADDLAELARRAGYAIERDLAAFRDAVAAAGDHLSLLQVYSGLFVTPPAPVAINTGLYLDGAILGPSERELSRWYAGHGLGRPDTFHDLADHVSVQLEFVAHLFGRAELERAERRTHPAAALATEAGDFLATFPGRWLGPFTADLADRAAAGKAGPYLALAQILACAANADAEAFVGPAAGSDAAD